MGVLYEGVKERWDGGRPTKHSEREHVSEMDGGEGEKIGSGGEIKLLILGGKNQKKRSQ